MTTAQDSFTGVLDHRNSGLAIQFGGQGNDYMDELSRAVLSSASARQFVQLAQSILEAEANGTPYSCLHPFLWSQDPTSRPSRSTLMAAPVSYPLVFLTQVATYLAFVEANGWSHEAFLRRLRGATGHSQGVVAAVLLASATTSTELITLGLQYLRLMFWHGVRAQTVFDSFGSSGNKPAAATPMLHVRGLPESTVRSCVDAFNTRLGGDLVQVSLVNDPVAVVVTGLSQSLGVFHATLDGQEHVDPIRLDFLSVSCAFHSSLLAQAQSLVEADAARLHLAVRGNALNCPVIGTTAKAINLQSYGESNVIPLLIQMQLTDAVHWPVVTSALQSIPGVTHVLDFGPGRGTPLLLHRDIQGLRVHSILHQPTEQATRMSDMQTQVAMTWATILDTDVALIHAKSSFFDLGGDSLSAIQAVAECNALGLHLTVAQFLRDPILGRVARARNDKPERKKWPSAAILARNTIEKCARGLDGVIVYPVTPMQGGMLAATSVHPSANVLQVTLKLSAPTTQSSFESAFRMVVAQNAILQTTFASTEHGMFQVHPTTPRPVGASIVASPSNISLGEYLQADLARGFQLDHSTFIRLAMLCPPTSTDVYGVITIHHALIDGWSMDSFLSDLLNVMDRQSVARRPSFRTVVDYIEAQDNQASAAFWRAYLGGFTPHGLEFVAPTCTITEARYPLVLTNSVTSTQLAHATSRAGVSIAELTTFAWAATLRKFTRQCDVVFGQVLANRQIPVHDAQRILGPLLSTVPCRVHFNDKTHLEAALQALQTTRRSIAGYSHVGLSDIAKACGEFAPHQLFDTLFGFQQWPRRRTLAGVEVIESWKTAWGATSQNFLFELLVEPTNVVDMPLTTSAHFLPTKMSRNQAKSLLDEFDYTLFQLCDILGPDAEPPATAADLWSLSFAQMNLITAASCGPEVPLPFELLHHGFEYHARQSPYLRAVEFDGRWLSYGELDAQANAVARQLQALGVTVGSRVAVVMDRCLEFPIALLATHKTGASTIPMDASFPATRLEFMLSDA
ncbi:hypothetical protein DYB25_011162, partial [Aphanomyces astaci]